jgi:hypothetical protein
MKAGKTGKKKSGRRQAGGGQRQLDPESTKGFRLAGN